MHAELCLHATRVERKHHHSSTSTLSSPDCIHCKEILTDLETNGCLLPFIKSGTKNAKALVFPNDILSSCASEMQP